MAAPADVNPAQAPLGRSPGTSARADAATTETDGGGRVIAWSAVAQAVFGWTAQGMLETSNDCMFTPQDLANHRAANEPQCALVDGRANDERWHPRSSGALFWDKANCRLCGTAPACTAGTSGAWATSRTTGNRPMRGAPKPRPP